MDWGALFKSPSDKGCTDSPLFFGALGAGTSGYVLYTLAVGKMAISKGGGTVVTRAGQPGFFWLSVLIIGVLGAGLLLHAVRQYRRNIDA